jgi:hypothetical protein
LCASEKKPIKPYKLTEYSKIINNTILGIIILICAAFSVFLIVNWNYISNPELVPGYVETQATFSYGRDNLAKYRHWGFQYPMAVIPYLIYIESVLLVHLIFKKNLLLSKVQWIITLTFLLIMIFSEFIFANLYKLLDRNEFWKIEYQFDNIIGTAFYVAFLFLLIASFILMFIPKFKKYRKFLILSLSTILLLVIFVFAHFEFFFD